MKNRSFVISAIFSALVFSTPTASGQPSEGVGSAGEGTPGTVVLNVNPGSPLVDRVSPLDKSSRVLIPTVISSVTPVVTTKIRETLNQILRKKGSESIQAATVFDRTPVRPVAHMVLGGIVGKKKEDLPFVDVNSRNRKPAEIQMTAGIPIAISVSNLPKRSSAKIVVLGSRGKQVSLGIFRTLQDGDLNIPPITLEKISKSRKIQILMNDTVRATITLRTP